MADTDTNAVNPPLAPPLLFLLVFLAAFLLNAVLPLEWIPPGWRPIPAVLFSLGGLAIFSAAALTMRAGKTPPSPYKPVRKLLTTGPYLRTRNPMYLAFAWIYMGFAFGIAPVWPLLLFPVLIFAVNRFVILPEEAYMERRFGAAYRDYKARTRRWM